MRSLILLSMMLFSFSSFAGGTCSATQAGYESYCAAQPDQSSCNFQSQCRWASSGYGTCSGKDYVYEAYCSVQPGRIACESNDQCFWSCEYGPGTCN